MAQGILILGLNGCGKTTVGRLVAAQLGFLRLDAEDYYFPTPGCWAVSRTQEEAAQLMAADIERYGDFVLSCVRCNTAPEIVQQIRLAAVLRTSPEIRALRILQRERERFGDRVLPGGDMYDSQQAFRAFAAARPETAVSESLKRLHCPVLELDAASSPAQIAEKIIGFWHAVQPERKP